VPPKEGWARAKAMAAAAVALDPELGAGHASLGLIRSFADWDWAGAEEEFRRAIELNPSYWVTPYWYSMVLGFRGRYDEAERQALRAQELEPVLPMVFWVRALNAFRCRHYGETIDLCLKAIEIDPYYPLARAWLGMAYEQESRRDDAIREMEKA